MGDDPRDKKKALIGLLLQIFVGGAGIGRLYYGYDSSGAAELVLFLSPCLVTCATLCFAGLYDIRVMRKRRNDGLQKGHQLRDQDSDEEGSPVEVGIEMEETTLPDGGHRPKKSMTA